MFDIPDDTHGHVDDYSESVSNEYSRDDGIQEASSSEEEEESRRKYDQRKKKLSTKKIGKNLKIKEQK